MYGVDNSSQTLIQLGNPAIYLDLQVRDFFLATNLLVCGTAGLFGIVGNVINIIVFYKQGYTDSVNITLTALALSDMGALLTLQLINFLTNPWILHADIDTYPIDLCMMIAFYPHNYFIRVCGFVTSFASFERCICVVSPLKVRNIITPKRALVVNVLIFSITTLALFPPYYIGYLDWTYIPAFNRTKLTVIYRQNPYTIFDVSYIVTDLVAPYTTFFILITSTSIIAIKLQGQAKWRTSTVKSGTKISTKEKKTVVMLSTISIMFVVCLIPQSTVLTAMSFVQDLSYGGKYFDVTMLGYCVSYFSETILSSVNIFIYLRMSHKYRESFNNVFKMGAI
ncbi:galanin-like G-protein coupled receptor npr-9 [Physella acuta]|uniref:galanin-like G-protein coupled receptor npr-9 n=1 Tax=Physella acuta TaxID=109671 RepID=UPI0027DBA760|nr:galanin-like G-protein coupled receptor npr-9 [Physella acuta]